MDACTSMRRRQFSFLSSLSSYFHSRKGKGAGKVTLPWENFSGVLQVSAHFLWSEGAMEIGCIEASHVCSLFISITSVILLVLKTQQLLMFSPCFSSSPRICKLCNETLAMLPQVGKTAKIDLWGRKKLGREAYEHCTCFTGAWIEKLFIQTSSILVVTRYTGLSLLPVKIKCPLLLKILH